MSKLSDLRSDASQTISNYVAETKRVLGDYGSTAKDALDTHRRRVTHAFERRLGGTGDDSAAGRSASGDDEPERAGSDDDSKWGDDGERTGTREGASR